MRAETMHITEGTDSLYIPDCREHVEKNNLKEPASAVSKFNGELVKIVQVIL